MDGFFAYSSGPGPQTPLDRAVSPGVPPVRAAELGFGTDSGLAGSLNRSVSPSSPSLGTGYMPPMGTDSGLTNR